MTNEVKNDLLIWYEFLHTYNGYTLFLPNRTWTSNESKLGTDASHIAGAAVCDAQWYPTSWKQFHISVLEFYPILVAVAVFKEKLQNKRVLFYCDNSAVVEVPGPQRSR